MEVQQLELDLWQSLETASRFPETANLRSLCDALEQTFSDQSLAEQLTVAGDVLVQLSEICGARADLLISGWEHQHNPTEPVVNLEECVDLFVQSLSLDVTDLFEEPEPVQYPTNRRRKAGIQADGSVVREVDKDALLSWVDKLAAEQPLDETQMVEQILDLAHGEAVEEWSRAISNYLLTYTDQKTYQEPITISLIKLHQAIQKPLIELWLGLLLGNSNYSLYQTSEDFYNLAGVEVAFTKSK
jgi:hypothetical protein